MSKVFLDSYQVIDWVLIALRNGHHEAALNLIEEWKKAEEESKKEAKE